MKPFRSLPAICMLVVLGVLSACASSEIEKSEESNTVQSPAKQSDTLVDLCVQYMSKGMNEIALEDCLRALKKDPDNSRAHDAIAVLYESLGETAGAREHFDRAVDLDPSNASAQNNYGRFLCAQGDYAEADERFRRAYENPLYPNPWVPLTNAGRCAQLAGKPQEAESLFREALNRNPRFSGALLQMAKFSIESKNYLSARAFLQRFLDVREHTPETLWIGIQSETALQNQAAVEEYLLMLRAKFPESKEAALAGQAFPSP